HLGSAFILEAFGSSLSIWGATIYPFRILLSTTFLWLAWIAVAGLVAFFLPNSFERTSPDLRPGSMPLTRRRAVYLGILIYVVLICSIAVDRSGFIYSQF